MLLLLQHIVIYWLEMMIIVDQQPIIGELKEDERNRIETLYGEETVQKYSGVCETTAI